MEIFYDPKMNCNSIKSSVTEREGRVGGATMDYLGKTVIKLVCVGILTNTSAKRTQHIHRGKHTDTYRKQVETIFQNYEKL